LLNPDAFSDAGWLEALMIAARDYPDCAGPRRADARQRRGCLLRERALLAFRTRLCVHLGTPGATRNLCVLCRRLPVPQPRRDQG
jgi:hypothetical protein